MLADTSWPWQLPHSRTCWPKRNSGPFAALKGRLWPFAALPIRLTAKFSGGRVFKFACFHTGGRPSAGTDVSRFFGGNDMLACTTCAGNENRTHAGYLQLQSAFSHPSVEPSSRFSAFIARRTG